MVDGIFLKNKNIFDTKLKIKFADKYVKYQITLQLSDHMFSILLQLT